jgi:hypothetical protein
VRSGGVRLPAARPARRVVPLPERGPDAPPLRQRLRSLPSISPLFGKTGSPETPSVLRRADPWTPPSDVEPPPVVEPVDLDALAHGEEHGQP